MAMHLSTKDQMSVHQGIQWPGHRHPTPASKWLQWNPSSINRFHWICGIMYWFKCFTYDGTCYKQSFSMPMSSMLSALLGNVETDWLTNLIPKDVPWMRYVDDILLMA